MTETRYTLSLPREVYDEIRSYAERHNKSIKEVVSLCLKFGLIAMKLDEEPNKELIIREHLSTGSNGNSIKDVVIKLVY